MCGQGGIRGGHRVGRNPPSYARRPDFSSPPRFQPRVRLVIRIPRMRNTTIQTFYGQIASFPNVMNRVLHFTMTTTMMIMIMRIIVIKIFSMTEDNKVNDTMFKSTNPKLLLDIGRTFFTTYIKFEFCFWPPLQDIMAMFLATFLPRYPTPKFDHFRHIRDARAAAAAPTTSMISFFKKLSSLSWP